ncbi:MAG: acylphosphatase [Erysipelotrichaceae bacterium]|nr:acylphosphatase [Erysipelotrichaceae bacterium]
MKKRYHIIYTGYVQGVGFRWTLMMIARSLGIVGYAKNLSNGNVEVEIEGDEYSLDAFNKKVLEEQDGYIHIEDYAIKEIPIKEDEPSFGVKF